MTHKKKPTLLIDSLKQNLVSTEKHPINFDKQNKVDENELESGEKEIKLVSVEPTVNKLDVNRKESKISLRLYEKLSELAELHMNEDSQLDQRGESDERSVRDSDDQERQDSRDSQESEGESIEVRRDRSDEENHKKPEESNIQIKDVVNMVETKDSNDEIDDSVIVEKDEAQEAEQKQSEDMESTDGDKRGEEMDRMMVVVDNKAISNKEKVIRKVKEVEEELTKEGEEKVHLVDQILSKVEDDTHTEEEQQKKVEVKDGKDVNSG